MNADELGVLIDELETKYKEEQENSRRETRLVDSIFNLIVFVAHMLPLMGMIIAYLFYPGWDGFFFVIFVTVLAVWITGPTKPR
jgi:uncharacterized membrane protein